METFTNKWETVLEISNRTGLSIESVSREISYAMAHDEIMQDLHSGKYPKFRRKKENETMLKMP